MVPAGESGRWRIKSTLTSTRNTSGDSRVANATMRSLARTIATGCRCT
ncbi:Uncharacterised protein [Mycobacteroides abscessus subsp. abscessus]|nr:Uncharacterised protein [Mycobacteroides abscessus subsp. abscessus]